MQFCMASKSPQAKHTCNCSLDSGDLFFPQVDVYLPPNNGLLNLLLFVERQVNHVPKKVGRWKLRTICNFLQSEPFPHAFKSFRSFPTETLKATMHPNQETPRIKMLSLSEGILKNMRRDLQIGKCWNLKG